MELETKREDMNMLPGTIFTDAFIEDNYNPDDDMKKFLYTVTSIVQQLVGAYVAGEDAMVMESVRAVSSIDSNLANHVILELIVLIGAILNKQCLEEGLDSEMMWLGVSEFYSNYIEARANGQ